MSEFGAWKKQLSECKLSLINRSFHDEALFIKLKEQFIGNYGNNDNMMHEDLSLLCQKHTFLMESVIEIHKNEVSDKTSMLVNSSRNLSKIAEQGEHGTQGERIYTLNDKNCEYVFIGDLHSDSTSLIKLLDSLEFVQRYNKAKDIHLVFTGDYVDRGKKHLELMSCIFLLKYLFADRVSLLRGNHDGGIRLEDQSIELPYRIPDEDDPLWYFPRYTEELAVRNPSFHHSMTDKYLMFFDSLPLIALIISEKHCILAVHGGLPRPTLGYGENDASLRDYDHYAYVTTASDLTSDSIKDYLDRSVVQNIMWSDPERSDGELYLEKKRYRYSRAHFAKFQELFKIDIVIRGHEAHDEGIVSYFDDQLYTNFASGMFRDGSENADTAYDHVMSHVLKYTKEFEFERVSI